MEIFENGPQVARDTPPFGTFYSILLKYGSDKPPFLGARMEEAWRHSVAVALSEKGATREGYRFNSLCPAPLNTPLLQDWLGDDIPRCMRRTSSAARTNGRGSADATSR